MREAQERPRAAAAPGAGTVHRPPSTDHAVQPWYREPWPWILMAGPAAAIVASAVMLWFAVTTADDLVADDYDGRGPTPTLARPKGEATGGGKEAP